MEWETHATDEEMGDVWGALGQVVGGCGGWWWWWFAGCVTTFYQLLITGRKVGDWPSSQLPYTRDS